MNQAHVHPIARFYSTLTTAPALLPGEDPDHYQLIRDAVVREIDPQTAIEWLFVSDLVELSWDILRYRRLRQKVLEASREPEPPVKKKAFTVADVVQHIPDCPLSRRV